LGFAVPFFSPNLLFIAIENYSFSSIVLKCGKITNNESDIQKIAQLLSEARAFYDAEMIAQIINAMLRSYYHHQNTMNNNKKPTIDSVTPSEVKYGRSLQVYKVKSLALA